MSRENKVSLKERIRERNKVLCDKCNTRTDTFFIVKQKNDKNYCASCHLKESKAPGVNKEITKSDFDKMLKMALDTPPLEFDWEKKHQKKQRTRKKDSK